MARFKFGEFELDAIQCELLKSSEKVDLEPQVYCLLELLILNHNEIVSRDDMIEKIWDGRGVSNNVIDNRIKAARAAVGDDGKTQALIKTYPNRGYKFVGEVTEYCEKMANTVSENPGEIDANPLTKSLVGVPVSMTFVAVAVVAIGAYFWVIPSDPAKQESSPTAASTSTILPAEKSVKNAALDIKTGPSTIAVMPYRVVGNLEHNPQLPSILNYELSQAVTAIDRLSVVSVTAGTGNESAQKLSDTLNTDYLVNINVTTDFGENFQFLIQLVRTVDNIVLWSKNYSTNTDDRARLTKWVSDTALNATIAMSNSLNLSMNQYAPYLVPYEFQAKIELAKKLIATDHYSNLGAAIDLLREVVEDEPDYLPAYSALFYVHWVRLNYSGHYENETREMSRLAAAMYRIAPDASETLVARAVMQDLTSDGFRLAHTGEVPDEDPIALLTRAVEKSPQNAIAYTILVLKLARSHPTNIDETQSRFEDALRQNPTNPRILADYSWALFCSDNMNKALELSERNVAWNNEHPWAVERHVRIASATGDYEKALQLVGKLLEKQKIQHELTKGLRNLFYDLGRPEQILEHIDSPAVKAQVLAMMGEEEKALADSDKEKGSATWPIVRMMINPNDVSPDYTVYPSYLSVKDQSNIKQAYECALEYLAIDAHALSKIDPERAVVFVDMLRNYYSNKPATTLDTREKFLGLMALHVLEGNKQKALEVMDVAINKGFVFLGYLKGPVLQQLVNEQGFEARYNKMKKHADEIIAKFDQTFKRLTPVKFDVI